MIRTLRLTVLAIVLPWSFAACGSGEESSGAGEPKSEVSASAEPSPSESSPSAEPGGPVKAFDIRALCPVDEAASNAVTGTPTKKQQLKPGDRAAEGAPVQGFTCIVTGPKGRIDADVITIPQLVERRKTLDYASLLPCTTEEPHATWDKAWSCEVKAGSFGPIFIRNGESTVMSCSTSMKGAQPAAVEAGKKVCDAILEQVGG